MQANEKLHSQVVEQKHKRAVDLIARWKMKVRCGCVLPGWLARLLPLLLPGIRLCCSSRSPSFSLLFSTLQGEEPAFRGWRRYTRERKEHRRGVMTRMLNRLEAAGVWVNARLGVRCD